MNNRHIRSGIFFISLGIVFLLINFNIVSGWSLLRTLIEYWPAIFIVIGINIIFRKNQIVRVITWLLFLTAIVGYSYFYDGNFGRWDGQWTTASSNVQIENAASLENGVFTLGLGGTRIKIDSTDSRLVDAYISDRDIVKDYRDDGKTAYISFKNNNNLFILPGSHGENRFSMNKDVIWDMEIDTGAIDGYIDMTDLKVKDLNIKSGAANFKIIFGDNYKAAHASIKAGASSFDVVVPKGSGVRVNLEGALTGNNLNSLGWGRDGKYYVSPGYDSAVNKIDIDVSMGVGSFNVSVQ